MVLVILVLCFAFLSFAGCLACSDVCTILASNTQELPTKSCADCFNQPIDRAVSLHTRKKGATTSYILISTPHHSTPSRLHTPITISSRPRLPPLLSPTNHPTTHPNPPKEEPNATHPTPRNPSNQPTRLLRQLVPVAHVLGGLARGALHHEEGDLHLVQARVLLLPNHRHSALHL